MKFYNLQQGDCLAVLRTLPAESVDAVVTDPPYGLGETPDMTEVLQHWLAGDDAKVAAGKAGFMGKSWDSFVPGPATWREVLRVLKPGGHLLAFAGSRTQDLMGLSIRMAGFDIRDGLTWMYGSGFPKSLDVSKAIDKTAGLQRTRIPGGVGSSNTQSLGKYKAGEAISDEAISDEAQRWSGFGTALKPAFEPIIVARKPLPKGATVEANVRRYGTGALNIDGCRIGRAAGDTSGWAESGSKASENRSMSGAKPDNEAGRWPPNVLLTEGEGDACPVAELDRQSGALKSGYGDKGGASRFFPHLDYTDDDLTGAPFLYNAKAPRSEREAGCAALPAKTGAEATDREEGTDGLNSPRAGAGRTAGSIRNYHPTVKPISVMRWLCRLVGGQPGAVILDPFLGSGTTGIAALAEGFNFIGIEREAEYLTIAQARIAHHAPDAEILT